MSTDSSGLNNEVVIVGAGPAGLACAIMLARSGFSSIRVLDKLSPPPTPDSSFYKDTPERNYNLGLSGRGQPLLEKIDVLDVVKLYGKTVIGRVTWDKEGHENINLTSLRKCKTICIQRDRLTAVLLAEAHKYNSISVIHNVEVSSIFWDDSRFPYVEYQSTVTKEKLETIKPSLLIGADGFNSIVASSLDASSFSSCRLIRFKDKKPVLFKTLALQFDLDLRTDSWYRTFNGQLIHASEMNLSAVAQAGADLTLEILPTKEGNGIGLILYKPDNQYINEANTEDKVRRLLHENFPQFIPVMPERIYQQLSKQRDQKLPVFQVAKCSLHGPRTVLIGDAIHTVKPYFGMGVNSALEDIFILGDCLKNYKGDISSLDRTLAIYSKRHTKNAQALVRMSRSFDSGFFTFVLPIILDSLSNKYLPRFFSPIGLRMFQLDNLEFHSMARIKRRDRILQLLIILCCIALFLSASIGFISLV